MALQVVLKVLGQHAEPEHLAYLLSLAPRKKLGSLNLEELIALLENVDVKLALPLQTLEKLKEARVMRLPSSLRCVLMRPRHGCRPFTTLTKTETARSQPTR